MVDGLPRRHLLGVVHVGAMLPGVVLVLLDLRRLVVHAAFDVIKRHTQALSDKNQMLDLDVSASLDSHSTPYPIPHASRQRSRRYGNVSLT